MTAYGASAGISYKFGGTVANTLQAHRMIQHFQDSKGAEVADELVNSLYRQYFEEEKHPSSHSTLLAACLGMFPFIYSLIGGEVDVNWINCRSGNSRRRSEKGN